MFSNAALGLITQDHTSSHLVHVIMNYNFDFNTLK